MEVNTSTGVILKLVEFLNEIHSKELLEITKKLKETFEIQLYAYKVDYTGKINSADYWNDISLLASSDLIKLTGDNPKLSITDRGLNTIQELELELPTQINEVLPQISQRG